MPEDYTASNAAGIAARRRRVDSTDVSESVDASGTAGATGRDDIVDPTDLLRAMLAISPEDAAAVREDAAEAMKPAKRNGA